ncbi:MAG TPA: hypothetical protein VN285_05555 [Candidatus Deferrimicrobium sp.]|nr:hypothetical protein [Candidatus Deferrimicrobium sp.]
MAFCPACHRELPEEVSECFACGCDLTDAAQTEWVVLGAIESKLYADFAREALSSYRIPAVIMSKDGFFGNIGLPLRPFYHAESAPFEISVPAACRDEAVEILNMTISGKWQRRES